MPGHAPAGRSPGAHPSAARQGLGKAGIRDHSVDPSRKCSFLESCFTKLLPDSKRTWPLAIITARSNVAPQPAHPRPPPVPEQPPTCKAGAQFSMSRCLRTLSVRCGWVLAACACKHRCSVAHERPCSMQELARLPTLLNRTLSSAVAVKPCAMPTATLLQAGFHAQTQLDSVWRGAGQPGYSVLSCLTTLPLQWSIRSSPLACLRCCSSCLGLLRLGRLRRSALLSVAQCGWTALLCLSLNPPQSG